MITREDLEQREFAVLSACATKAAESRGRVLPEEQCSIRTDFQRDRDRIIHSKAFRRLMHKTGFYFPGGRSFQDASDSYHRSVSDRKNDRQRRRVK